MEQENKHEEKEENLVKTEVEYSPGYEEQTAIFELLKDYPIKSGFSWGSKSGTMSYKWMGDEEDVAIVRKRVKSFLNSLGIDYPGIIHMLGVLEGAQDQIQTVEAVDIDPESDETVTKANFVYTFDPKVGIAIRPADCPISIIYARTKDGKDLAGFIHSSGASVNAGIPRLSVDHLLQVENVDLTSIRVGITPGISRDNYSIDEEITIERTTYPIIERNWKDFIDPKKTESDKERRRVDILGATVMQYIEAGVKPNQIEAYDVDTFNAHKNGVGFSHRLFSVSEGKVNPGRYMVALQLSNS